MKRINILIISLFLVSLYSCSDFLDVNSDSKFTPDYVYGTKEEINKALNSVYAQLMSGDTYGDKYMNTYALNSDVEFAANSNMLPSTSGNDYKCFDATSLGSDLAKTWAAAYKGVEYANQFVFGVENSPLFAAKDTTLAQQIGESKVLRAMYYHDMVVLFGDIPFSLTPSYEVDNLVMPIASRDTILTVLINDLIDAAPRMKFARDNQDGIERASKEFCWSMIARMAMTRAGYSLRADKSSTYNVGTMERASDYKEYYEIAKIYADSVISSGTHSLSKSFRQVFIDECNYIVTNNDDPIFEIPFLKESSGSVGYVHGPTGNNLDDVTTGKNIWGKSNGGLRLNAFYRYSFDIKDLRLDYTVGMWYYTHDGIPTIRTDYNTHCNKWSKFWQSSGNAMGKQSDNKTGINFPYMRYADVLLMYAEAVNELENGVNGTNGEKAKEAFKQVRKRAFSSEDQGEKVDRYLTTASATKESFFNAIMDERKWEFGGENMRWKDLVRWDKYAKIVYDVFTEYYAVAAVAGGDSSFDPEGKYDQLPVQMFYKIVPNPGDINAYPNTTLDILEIFNLYEFTDHPGTGWEVAEFYNWADADGGYPKAQCLYSLRGYIKADEMGNITPQLDPNNLPPVRYILPYPKSVIQISAGAYKNYYGYN